MKKKRIIFLIYAQALGFVGGHRHYLGQHRLALLYPALLLISLGLIIYYSQTVSWLKESFDASWIIPVFIPGVIAYIEIIFYSIAGEEKFNAKYNS